MIAEVDKLGTGEIEYEPLSKLISEHQNAYLNQRVSQAFKKYDTEGKRSIHYREAKDMVRLQENIDAEKTAKLSREIEKTSKGLISFADLYKVIKRSLEIA